MLSDVAVDKDGRVGSKDGGWEGWEGWAGGKYIKNQVARWRRRAWVMATGPVQ